MKISNTKATILTEALELIQLKGYNGFSFHHLSEKIGIKTASIHYHFATKGDLGIALVQKIRAEAGDYFTQLDRDIADPGKRLEKYFNIFRSTFENGHRMCVGGMLALESKTLPAELVAEVRCYFDDHEAWLSKTLQIGRKQKVFSFNKSSREVARNLFAALEGAMLSACAFGEVERFNAAATWYLNQLRS